MVYVIAEIGSNHNGDLALAKQMLDAAVNTGVNAVKFQTFTASKLISKYAPKADYQIMTTGNEDSQLEMTRKLEFSHKKYLAVKKYGEQIGVDVFSTAFDLDSLDFLISTGMRIFKVPSGAITNLPFLEKVGSEAGQVILSTGMATMDEICAAIDVLERNGSSDITILHCTTEYPTAYKDLNLNVIKTYEKEFEGYKIGFSDHSIGHEVPIMAAALGAQVIEKHFTIDNNLPGPDQKASGTPDVFSRMIRGIRISEQALGQFQKRVMPVEFQNRVVARESIVAKTFIGIGEKFTIDNVTIKRPGNGISPMSWYELLGNKSEGEFEPDMLISDSRFQMQGLGSR